MLHLKTVQNMQKTGFRGNCSVCLNKYSIKDFEKLILIYEIQLSLLIASENYPEDPKTMLWRVIGAFIGMKTV